VQLDKVQMAEDRFAQDLIEAEYDEEEEEALEGEEDVSCFQSS
jgi:hypothetical protein